MEINQKATVEIEVNGEAAKQEMRDLEKYATSLKGRLADAHKAGDTKQIRELEKELKKTNIELKNARTNAQNIDHAMNNLGLATPKELRNIIRDINKKLNSGHVKRGSAEWRKYVEQLKRAKAEMADINDEMKESEGWLERFNNGFAKWGGLLATAAAGVTGVSMALSSLRKNRDDKQASAANLKALTGLDDSSIQWLTKQAEILSTTMDDTKLRVTQSSKEILEAYMLVGSAKPDLLSNKEALNEVTIEAMRLSKAAKMDLKEAVNAVTLAMNQYGASAKEVGRYTNVMAAGSKMGAAAVQSITSAVVKAGVTASGAQIPIEQLVGTIETLAEKGIKDEVAGTGLKMFFLRLQTGAKETNPAVVGLQTALQNLKKLTTQGIIDRFGAETYSVAKALIDGADKVDYFTKAVTGTNIAVEQAAINSDTYEAKKAQAMNQIKEAGIELMERLNPSLAALTGWTTKIITALPILIDWFKKYITTISLAVAGITAYTVAINRSIIADKLKVLWTQRVTVAISSLWKMLKANPWGLVITAATMLVGVLIDLRRRQTELSEAAKAHERINKKTLEQYDKESFKVKMLTELIHDENVANDKKIKYINDLKKIIPGYNGMLDKEGKLINDNTDAINDYLTALEAQIRLKAAQEEREELFRKKYQKERQLKNDEKNLNKAKTEYDDTFEAAKQLVQTPSGSFGNGVLLASDASRRERGYENAQKAVENTKKEISDIEAALDEINKEIQSSTADNTHSLIQAQQQQAAGVQAASAEELKARDEKLRKDLEAVEASANKEEAIIKMKYAKGEISYRAFCEAINQNDIKELDNKMALYTKDSKEYNDYLVKKQDLYQKNVAEETKYSVEAIGNRAKEEEVALVSAYYNQRISKIALNEGLFRLDIETLQKKQALYAKGSKDWLDYESQIADTENRERLRKAEEYQQMLASLRSNYAKKDLEALMAEELGGLDYLHQNGLIKEEEYQKMLQQIKEKYLVDKIEDVDSSESNDLQALKDKYTLINQAEMAGVITHQEALQQKAMADAEYLDGLKQTTQVAYSTISSMLTAYSNYANACQDLEIAKVEKKYATEIKAAGNNTSKVKKLEEQKELEIAKIKSAANKKAMKIEIAQAFASMALSAINAYSSAAQVPLIGYILGPIAAAAAVAAGMMQIATIKKQHQAQEIGYYSGGFTPLGDPKKEVGTVHAGEFVANHQTLRNPNVMPVLQLIDYAQKNNTVGSLTTDDITASLNGRLPSSGTVVERAGNQGENYDMQIITEVAKVLGKLHKRLDSPIIAETYATGKGGFLEAEKLVNQMKTNARRVK